MHIDCPCCKSPIPGADTASGEVTCSACGTTFRLEQSAPSTCAPGEAAADPAVLDLLGHFELLAPVGAGAFGTVYKARDPRLDRVVAIKVPHAGHLVGPQVLDRFLREARSAAQLRHPAIVSVHEVGESDGVPYLVSDFVPGATLAEALGCRRLGFREAAELIAAVADALQFAHEHGVVHRDVKPSNIIIGADGRPCVMDFGLARRDAGEITMTLEGQVLGTPAYMSPEQARGEGHAVDGRTDVYSLGVLLYELLTGGLPFRGNKAMLLHQVLNEEPRPPRRLNDRVPRDLETIALKAMEKEPGRRYATARTFADDLRRWLNGKPILARPAGLLERGWRWARRRPAAAGLLAASGVAALALVGLAVGWYFNGQLQQSYDSERQAHEDTKTARAAEEQQRMKAQEAEQKAITERDEKEKARQSAAGARDQLAKANAELDNVNKELARTEYVHSIRLADAALKGNDNPEARRRLNECDAKLRHWEWHHLNGRCGAELMVFRAPAGSTTAISPDWRRIASWAEDGTARVADMLTGRELFTLKGIPRPSERSAPRFSPNGSRVVFLSGSRNAAGQVRVYDAGTGEPTFTVEGAVSLTGPALHRDGARVAVCRVGENRLRVYDLRSGKEVLTLAPKAAFPPGDPTFSPDGTRIAVHLIAAKSKWAIFDATSGTEAVSLPGSASPWALPAFSPDGSRVAVNVNSEGPTDFRIFEVGTGRAAYTLRDCAPRSSPVFAPDGASVVSVGADGMVRVHDAGSGELRFTLSAPTFMFEVMTSQGPSTPPTYSPDGSRITSVGRDGVIRVYDSRSGGELLALDAPLRLDAAAFSPDGARVAATGRDGVTRVYDVRGSTVPFEALTRGAQASLDYSPDRSRVVVTDRAGRARMLDARSGRELFALKGFGGPPVTFSPGGERFTLTFHGGGATTLSVHDAATGKQAYALTTLAFWPCEFSPDGARLAAGGADGRARIYDARTGKLLVTIAEPNGFMAAAFSADGRRVAFASDPGKGDGAVRVYDAATGKVVLTLKGPAPLGVPTFGPEGRLIAVAADLQRGDGAIRVFNGSTGREVVTLKARAAGEILWPTFTPDGRRVAAVSGGQAGDGTVRLHDAQTGAEVLTLRAPVPLSRVGFSPDGARVAATSDWARGDDMVRVYDAESGKQVLSLKGPRMARSPAFSADGTRLEVPGFCGILQVWDAPRDLDSWRVRRCAAFADTVLGWHREQADEAERAGRWFAAAFHLGRLLIDKNDGGSLHFRRGRALARLGKGAEAEAELRRALTAAKDLSAEERAEAESLLKGPATGPKK